MAGFLILELVALALGVAIGLAVLSRRRRRRERAEGARAPRGPLSREYEAACVERAQRLEGSLALTPPELRDLFAEIERGEREARR